MAIVALTLAFSVSMASALSVVKHFYGSGISEPKGVAIAGGYAYVTGGSYLTVLDITDPSNPLVVGSVYESTWLSSPTEVAVQGDYAYVTLWKGLSVVNVADPSNPVFETGVTIGKCHGVQVDGDWAIVTRPDDDGLSTVYIADPTSPLLGASIIASSDLDGAQGLAVVGNYAYIYAKYSKCLVVVDITVKGNPLQHSKICENSQLASHYSMVVVGNYAYVAGTGMAVVNIADPSSPTIVSYVSSGMQCAGMVAVDDTIYCATIACNNVLLEVSLDDPQKPVEVESVWVANCVWMNGIGAAGDHLYVAQTNGHALSVVTTVTSTSSTSSTMTLTSSTLTSATITTTLSTTLTSTRTATTLTITSSSSKTTSNTITTTETTRTSSTRTTTETTSTSSTVTTAAVLQLSFGGRNAEGLAAVGGPVGLAMIIILSLLLTSCCLVVLAMWWRSRSQVTPETSPSVDKWTFTRTMPPLEPSAVP